MPARTKSAPTTRPKQRPRAKGRAAYPKQLRVAGLALRERLRCEAAANGAGPMPLVEIRAWVDQHRDLWTTDQEVDQFIAWVRQTRTESRKR